MIETILLWILIAVAVVVLSPFILGVIGLVLGVLFVSALYIGLFLMAILVILLAAVASPFIILFEKIKSLRKK